MAVMAITSPKIAATGMRMIVSHTMIATRTIAAKKNIAAMRHSSVELSTTASIARSNIAAMATTVMRKAMPMATVTAGRTIVRAAAAALAQPAPLSALCWADC